MKSTSEQNFERELPSGYRQAMYINAKDAKFGIIFNVIAMVVISVIIAAAFISLGLAGKLNFSFAEEDFPKLMIAYLVLFVSMFGYIVLHELVHGAAYKALTGEKLTFGISWSCAFCGVPHIYSYRKTAIISTIAPFTIFTLLLIPLLAVLYFVSPLYYLIVAFVFGLHIGGCSGDLYVFYLLTSKFKDKKTLVRDTGPEQFFFVPDEENLS